ncbi:MAG: hypothetical protein HYY46_11635 [Deltaproteobacteria bacterium]|nr:hypothetical protein [Deltaproteobacteria bacterium]
MSSAFFTSGAVVWWSVALGVVGILVSIVLAWQMRNRFPIEESERYWLMGLFGLFPAWLFALWNLLGAGNFDSPTYFPPRAVISSSAAALIGVIVSDFVRRRRLASAVATAPAIYWLLGLAAFVAGWVIALWSLR